MQLAAVIPAYQAAGTIAEVVAATLAVLPDLVVLDDGSTDGTGDRAREAGARVIAHERNRGKGAALRTAADALLAEGFDGMVTLDADGQHLPGEIPKLFTPARDGAHLVLGVRDHVFAEMGRVRRVSNRVSSRLISIAAGEDYTDVQTGFRLYARAVLEEVGLREPGFEAESAIVVRAARSGYRIASVPVRMGRVDGRTTSHYRSVLDSLRIARAVVRARLEGSRGPRTP